MMLLKTVVKEAFEGAKIYKSYNRPKDSEKFENVELQLAEMEYGDAFLEALSREVAAYGLHTVFTYDYESSSDAGDGRDDSYKEEKDEGVDVTACIIQDGRFAGVLCESFGVQGFVLTDYPEAIINHPGNYGGKNYHFYRDMRFSLIRKG